MTRSQLIDDDARYAAAVARDPAADGLFFTAVRTTGVYCRPSCKARTPLRSNVLFFDSAERAEAAGFRPCKRCRPEQARAPGAEIVAAACKLIREADRPIPLGQLAGALGLSASHLGRLFKTATGLTPRAFAASQRNERVQAALAGGQSVTAALYDAGYGSSSAFYADAKSRSAMAPAKRRQGGAAEEIRYAIAECSLGRVLLAATSKGVCFIAMDDEDEALIEALRDRFPNASLSAAEDGFAHWVEKIVGFIEEPRQALDLPLDIRGAAFQERVWRALRAIPLGMTATYSEIAEAIGSPRGARAVAGACAANPVSLVVPCHRVVRADGSLSGYRWGVKRKGVLLAREKQAKASVEE